MVQRKKKTAARKVRPPKAVASKLPRPSTAKVAAAKRKFEQGIVTRGEAVQAGQPLTPGATHVIVGKTAAGTPILKRKRFSIS